MSDKIPKPFDAALQSSHAEAWHLFCIMSEFDKATERLNRRAHWSTAIFTLAAERETLLNLQ
jgi:hypothetical protein